MAGYSTIKIAGYEGGLVQEREEFLLPDDAYPKLKNAYVWREKIKRKNGCLLLGRLQRNLTTQSLGNTIATGVQFNLFTQVSRSGTITGITQANPGEVTTAAAHLLQTGQYVTIAGVAGMTQVNGNTYAITVTGASTFTIGVDTTGYGVYGGGGTWETNDLAAETLKTIVPGTVVITMPGPIVFTDQGNGTLTSVTPGNSGVINYITGNITLTTTAAAGTSTVTFSYYPSLPVMGIRTRELQNSLNDQTVFFDQLYAYTFDDLLNRFQEFIPGTTWNAAGEDVDGINFFWSTNYWVSQTTIPGTTTPLFSTSNRKLFWETNNSGSFGALADPPRITDGVTWVDFYDDAAPLVNSPWSQIGNDDTPNPVFLTNFLSMLPFRGRMVTFNTWEGINAASSVQYNNRIRWSTIGNPFIPYDNGPPSKGSWRDDIRGQGGFLDIPTSEDIISVGFVRDNLVIYCERSTWQLRYTGRSIAPFQIEKVNSELGGEGPFSSVQFDTSLVGVGDKGIVECDSYKSDRIDIKILDFVFQIQSANNGDFRIHGIRDFINRLAFWTIPLLSDYDPMLEDDERIFPNTRLVYNYENDSWSLFDDSFTTLGTYQPQSSRTWLTTPIPWVELDITWIGTQARGIPAIVGGNQQGYVEYLDNKTTNDPTLYITGIINQSPLPTVIESLNHNLRTGDVIGIRDIPIGTPYANLNGGVYGIIVGDNDNMDAKDNFRLMLYNPATGLFSTPKLDVPEGNYIGGGQINVRDNFNISSKRFGFADEGQSIQMGYFDILMNATADNEPGAISVFIYQDYQDYNEDDPSNTLPNNRLVNSGPAGLPDTFFNSVIPTTSSALNTKGGNKFWQRVFCPTRANFLTLVYTFSNAQMAGEEQTKEVQIDAQVLWVRKGGRLTQI